MAFPVVALLGFEDGGLDTWIHTLLNRKRDVFQGRATGRMAPMSWRYKGSMGSGVLADLGSHLTYLSEFLCGGITAIRGSTSAT